jgi:site-specific DNA-methyltransferase (adenine-specific)
VVLDNFNGSGTTGEVARKHGRRYVGIELNPEYLAMTRERFRQGYIFPVGVLEATA